AMLRLSAFPEWRICRARATREGPARRRCSAVGVLEPSEHNASAAAEEIHEEAGIRPRDSIDDPDAAEPDRSRRQHEQDDGCTDDNSAASAYAHSKMNSTSTLASSGSVFPPTAARTCLPASPNSSSRNSLAPLATWGCWVKFVSLLTKAPTRATPLSCSIPP